MTFGWLRPFSRECWRLAPDWRGVLGFMSNQANLVGASVVAVLIYVEAPHKWAFIALVTWVLLAALGTIIDQPEVKPDGMD